MTTRVEIMNDHLAVNAKPGAKLQEILESSGSGVPIATTSQTYDDGSDIIEIIAGMEYLSEKTEEEIKILNETCSGTCTPNSRLACFVTIEKPNGFVKIKYE